MNKLFNLSGSDAAENDDLEDRQAIAAACMDYRIPQKDKYHKYTRDVRDPGLGCMHPENIELTAKAYVAAGVNVPESHYGCGASLLAELNERKTEEPDITAADIPQTDVDKRAKKYTQELADTMSQISGNEVKAAHLTKKEMERLSKEYKSSPKNIYLFLDSFDPADYGKSGGFMIGGGNFGTRKYIESAQIAIEIALGNEGHTSSEEGPTCILIIGNNSGERHYGSTELLWHHEIIDGLKKIVCKPEYDNKIIVGQLPVLPGCNNFRVSPRHIHPELFDMQIYNIIPTTIDDIWRKIIGDESGLPTIT